MCSSGIRLGAWDYLRWKHVIAIKNEKTGEIIAAKLIVYAGEPEQYYSFITLEAYQALQQWMDFRASYGEEIKGDSWILRNMWKTSDVPNGDKGGGTNGLATVPKMLSTSAIRKMLARALLEQGVRPSLPKGTRRHEFKGAHGFRKFFETHAAQVMSFVNVEYLMGHSLGVSDSYYKPTESNVLADYLKAVDLLTISDTHTVKTTLHTLKEQLATKEKEDDYKNYVIAQTREELQIVKNKLDSIWQRHGKMLDSWERIGQRLDKITADATDKKKKNKRLSFAEGVDLINAHHFKPEVDEAREIRKELHS